MNPVERIRAALALESTDRVPVIPEMIQHTLELSGATHRAYSTNAAELARSQLASQAHYGYDAVYVSSDNYVLCEAMGALLHFPKDDPPQLVRHAVQTLGTAGLARVTTESGRLPVILEATRLCRQALGERVFVKTNIDSAPFSAAASAYGSQNFLLGLYDEPEGAEELLEFCTEAVITYGVAAAKAGAHGLAFGDSVAGLLSPAQYQKFALPYAKQAVSRLQELTGLPVFYHVCGNTSHLCALLVETGADCVEIDSSVPMEQMKPYAEGKCALEGNISTIEALYQGTPQDVLREANHIIGLFGNRGGLILSSACEVPRATPPENIAAIQRAALEYNY